MGRKRGFNAPFADLKVSTPVAPPVAAPPPPPAPRDEPDDENLFARAMQDVTPVGDAERIEPPKRRTTELADEDSEALAELEALVRGEGDFNVEDTGDVVCGRAPGVNLRTLDELRRGHASVRRHLDLHGFTREDAKVELQRFITEARRDDQGCVLVITGRGLGSPNGVSVLREVLPRWLSRAPLRAHVLAFCTAQRVDGGPGAYYVLLRRPGVRPFGGGG